MRTIAPMVTLAVALCAPARADSPPAGAAPTGTAAAPAAIPRGMGRDGHWRAARWGMTVDQLVAAFPGEARRLDKSVTLKDGNVVAAAIPVYRLEGQDLVVRFVFAKDALALVSLRTPEDRYAKPEVYERLAKALSERFGGPGEEAKDKEFIDLRQTRWRLAESQVDLKYIPGVVVILYSPAGSP